MARRRRQVNEGKDHGMTEKLRTTPKNELTEHITDIRQLAEQMALTAEGVPGMNLTLSKARIASVCRAFLALSETEERFPSVDADPETATIFIAFRRYTDDEPAKVVQRRVAACVDYDAAGSLLGVEIFDVLPEAPHVPE
jgi:hypothetical protein